MERDDELNAKTVASGVAPANDSGETLTPGSRLGAYSIVRLLGAGGMGRVYLAQQREPVQRKVALKLIGARADDPLARVYFEIERQALAQMRHPAIAQVYEAGTTPDGELYLAMEWVEGVPITDFCRSEKLDLAQRLALFERVCHGVQHAHQKGVIHRDLKPDNVLVQRVDGVPQPKIIDFGVAVSGGDQPTRAKVLVAGTTTYMSPEQASAQARDLDVRSDVYSLGVMLFEVLTDVGADTLSTSARHSAGALRETLLAADGLGERKAQLHADLLGAARALPTELRAIVRKALAGDREDRYASAAALGEDLQRYRERRPLAALPATRSYATRKFVSRHRWVLAGASAVVLALIVGIVLALVGLHRARVATQVAQTQRALAQRQTVRARQQTAKAKGVSLFLRRMLAGVSPGMAKGMDTKLMRSLLDSAAQDAVTGLAKQPAVRASVQDTIADTYRRLGQFREALQQSEAAAQAAAQAGLPIARQAVLLVSVGNILNFGGFVRPALVVCRAAAAMVSGLPPTDDDRLDVEKTLTWAEYSAGDLPRAARGFEDFLVAVRAQGKGESKGAIDALRGLSAVTSDMGKFAQAEALIRKLIALETKQGGPDSPDTLSSENDLAVVYSRQQQFAKAEAILRPLLARDRKVYGPDHPVTIGVLSNLGGAIRQQGRNAEAKPYYVKVLAYDKAHFGADDYRTVSAQSNLAELLRDAGQLRAAEKHARLAVDHADRAFGPHDGTRGYFREVLGTILAREKRYQDAEAAYLAGWKIYLASPGFGPDHPMAQTLVGHVIALYQHWHKPKLADKWRARLKPPASKVAEADSGG